MPETFWPGGLNKEKVSRKTTEKGAAEAKFRLTGSCADSIQRVKDGFLWVAGHETTFLLQAIKSLPAQNILSALNAPTLTERELQVVQHAAAGKTNKTIARELSLSEHTVKNYLFRAYEKLGVSSRIKLLFYLTLTGTPRRPCCLRRSRWTMVKTEKLRPRGPE